jgi:D-3-phosphoglycerate dehydrogenase
LGILGYGRIGKKIAEYGNVFGMEVGIYDPHIQKCNVKRFNSIETFLEWTDILSIHLPLNKETKGMLNENLLRKLPKGALIINTSRGAVIDEPALVKLLEEKHIAGAAVDVLSAEQPKELRNESVLLKYAKGNDNVIITPHIGGATIDSMKKTEVFVANKLKEFVKNHQSETGGM